ncbi:MAG: Gfo/Idh/MocA family oxidoreductase [Thermaceae bacterium]|nr:Gfo/Idh/MocA family oxidoreductase [Thermaceae bacterium]
MNKPVSVLIIGAGSRGQIYAQFAQQYPERMRVVGVAEPRAFQREQMAQTYGLPPENVFSDWREVASRGRLADAVVIATQDAQHVEPVEALAPQGYAILLEKPMAPDLEGSLRIVRAVETHGNLFAVCHVMRYTPYTQLLKRVLDSGTIGEIVSVEHLEPVGYWHQAHSFVRGNWRREDQSSSMLLQKSCHDLDWLRYLLGQSCTRISSFGSLKHFRAEEKPEGAAERCLDCSIEPTCPYSAKRIYGRHLASGFTEWPLNVLTPEPTPESVAQALREGPYGRCVYACDNDVVDHQVVNMEFAKGQTASFTMTAFTQMRPRETRIFGTRGELYGDGRQIRVYDFLTETTLSHDSQAATDGSILSGHGGGDFALMERFIASVATGDPSGILSGARESLEGHLMVFAAEQARKEGRVVRLEELES